MPVQSRMAPPPSPRHHHPIRSVTPVIGCIDIDCFEYQLYQREQYWTKHVHGVVANQKGVIVAVNQLAKDIGINRRTHVAKAQQLCLEKVGKKLHVFWKKDKFGKQDNSMCRAATHELTVCIKKYLDEKYPGVVILDVASSDEFFINLTPAVTNEIQRRRNKAGIQIPNGIVWERHNERKTGPFIYKVPHVPAERPDGMRLNNQCYGHKNDERLIIGALIMKELGIHIRHTTCLSSSSGVACNQLLAKVASALNKPKKVTILPEGSWDRVSQDLPINSVPGMGGGRKDTTGHILQEEFGIRTVADLRRVDWRRLEARFQRQEVQQMMARAKGQDSTPVLYRLAPSKMTRKMPKGDITTIKGLQRALHNLYMEIIMLLKEQNKWWNRKVDDVLVSWKTSNCAEATTKLLPLSSKCGGQLEGRVMKDIRSMEGFDPKNFIIKELSFGLKHWLPLRGNVQSLGFIDPNEDFYEESDDEGEEGRDGGGGRRTLSLSSLASVDSGVVSSIPIPSKLRVHRERPLPPKIPALDQELLGHFRINKDLSCSSDKDISMPTLLSDDLLGDLKDYDLMANYDKKLSPQGMAVDYTTYYAKKQEHFCQWLDDHEGCLQGTHFVAALGTLLRAFKTTENLALGDWTIYGVNRDGVVYLWEEQSNKSTRNRNIIRDETAYSGFLFENLITGDAPEGPIVDGITKTFPIQKIKLGKHKIVMMCHADAKDEDDNLVQATLSRDEHSFPELNLPFLTERKMKLWTQMVLSGSKTAVLGTRDEKSRITKIEKMTLDELEQEYMNMDEERRKLCFVFMHRFLDFVGVHLQNASPNIVKKFAWAPSQPNVVYSSEEPESEVGELLLPKIFLSVRNRSVDVTKYHIPCNQPEEHEEPKEEEQTLPGVHIPIPCNQPEDEQKEVKPLMTTPEVQIVNVGHNNTISNSDGVLIVAILMFMCIRMVYLKVKEALQRLFFDAIDTIE